MTLLLYTAITTFLCLYPNSKPNYLRNSQHNSSSGHLSSVQFINLFTPYTRLTFLSWNSNAAEFPAVFADRLPLSYLFIMNCSDNFASHVSAWFTRPWRTNENCTKTGGRERSLCGQTNLFCGSEVLATKQEAEMSAQNDDGDMWNVFATKEAQKKRGRSTEKARPANTCKINGFKWRS